MDEDQTTSPSPNTAPTWADFKPPVMTTPFANGESLNVTPSEASSVGPVETPSETLSQGFQSPALPDTPASPAPDKFPVEAPPPVSSPVASAVIPEGEEPVIPEPAPSKIETAAAASLDKPDPVVNSSSEVTSDDTVTVMSETISREPATEVPITLIPSILETPELPVGDPSLTSTTPSSPVSTPPSTTKPSKSFWPWLLVSLVVVLALGGLGYLYYNNAQIVPVSPSTSSQDLSILADSQGPDTWEKNYSTSLLASERGGLEFAVTDPPATPSASSSAKPTASTSAATASLDKVELTALKITIAKVEVHLATQTVVATGTAPEATKSAAKNIDRWETLRLNDTSVIDLMKLRLQGGALSSLGVTYLAAGHYTEVRLYLTAASATLADGSVVSLSLPGGAGVVKIVKNFDVSTTGTSKLLVDFDAPASVAKTGNDYRLSPVVGRVLYNSKEI